MLGFDTTESQECIRRSDPSCLYVFLDLFVSLMFYGLITHAYSEPKSAEWKVEEDELRSHVIYEP